MRNIFLIRVVLFLSICGLFEASANTVESSSARQDSPFNLYMDQYSEFLISGENAKHGIYDPSLEYAPDGVGWLAYSAVTTMPGEGVNIHLAKSFDAGKTWQHVMPINKAVKGILSKEGKLIDGAWVNEVSTLVYDPEDPGREWKLFWHKYFSSRQGKVNNRMFSHGWIAYRHAPGPEGPWSEEIALFGAGDNPVKPFLVKWNIKDFHPNLSKYRVLTEPGSLVVGDTLYLSFQAVAASRQTQQKHDIILLASVDHGLSWKYINTLLVAKDAELYEAEGFTGTSLVEEGDRYFLMVCPENFSNYRQGQLGTVIFEFEDISKGLLKKNKRGDPVLVRYLKTEFSKGGQSDYDQSNVNGGIIMPQSDVRDWPRSFRLYNTNQKIISE